MTLIDRTDTIDTATDGFVAALREQSRRYHDQHPFSRRMNDGELDGMQAFMGGKVKIQGDGTKLMALAAAVMGESGGTYQTMGRGRYSGCRGRATFHSTAIL